MKCGHRLLGAASAALCALTAQAAEGDFTSIPGAGQPWSALGGRTTGQGGNVVEGGVGWPGLYAAYHRGVSKEVDVGLRVAFVYAQEGNFSLVAPGMKFNLGAKVQLFDTGRVNLGVLFEPGPFFNVFALGRTVSGFSFPFGVRLGVHPASALSVALSFDVPLWVEFSGARGAYVPLLTGLGVEYFVDSRLLVFARTRMGPTLTPYGRAYFTLDATLGVGWRL